MLLRLDLRADEDRATAVATLASDQLKLWVEMDAVLAAYRQATPELQAKALEAWQTQNSERLAAIRLRAQQLSATGRTPELPAIEEVTLPVGATSEVEELLVEHAELFNERIQVENEFRDATPEAKQQALEAWEQRTEAKRAAQAELAVQVARQQPTFAAPVPLELPGGIDPRLREILGQQRALMNERVELENTIRLLPPAEQEKQRQQWEEKNAPRKAALLEQLKQLSQDQAPKTPPQ